VRSASEGEFEAFVRANAADLSQLARLLSADPAAAEDLAQATLLRAWRSWPRVRAAADRPAYVRQIMANTAVSRWRRRWRVEVPVGRVPERPGVDGYREVEERDQLVRAVRQLPARQRAAVVLRYFAGLDDAAVAGMLGCSVATVRSQISRALARLRVTTAAAETTPDREQG
jgi:RNA polymerase sigma-70 factor (sigma-E family)